MKNKKKALALLLTLALIFNITMPVYAADNDFSLVVNGRNYAPGTTEVQLMRIGAEDVASVRVSDDAASFEHDGETCKASSGVTGKLTKGTGYKIYATSDSNGVRTLMFKLTTARQENITVEVETKSATYTVNANSGYYGYSNDRGGSTTCDMNVPEKTEVDGGDTYSVTFTPVSGQEIIKLNIRPDYFDATNNIIDAQKASHTIGGASFSVTRSGESVTVTCKSVNRDFYITALTQNITQKYSLDVTTNNCSSNITHTTVNAGSSQNVTFTPFSGYNVTDIVITQGGKTAKIGYKDSSASLNGKTYKVVRNLDGSAVLTIPSMSGDVSVRAMAEYDVVYVKVNDTSRVDSKEAGVNYLRETDSFSITYRPDSDNDIRTIYCKTASGTYSAEPGDDYFVIEGNYYRMYTDYDGDVTIYLTSVPSNMEFSVNSRNGGSNYDGEHDITLKTIGGCESYDYDYTVDDGEDLSVSFYTTSSRYDICSLKVRYDGRTYMADVYDDDYIWVDGDRWYIDVDSDGDVTLDMVDIRADVTVTASTDYYIDDDDDYYGDVRIYEREDSHSNISWSGTNPFDYGDDTTIRVTADYDYIIDHIRFQMGGYSATIEPFETSFTLRGETYTVDWDTNRDVEVYIDNLRDDLTITAETERGSEKDYDGTSSRYTITRVEDTHGNVKWTGNNSYHYGDSKTITVTADKNYVIEKVKFQMGSASATISPFTTSFSLNGYLYHVNWKTNREFSVIMNNLNNNLKVTVTTEKGSEKDAPSNNATSTVPNSSGYHPAYMVGYGNGYFGADEALTRAQAVCLLSRCVSSGASSGNVSPYYFTDVPKSAWYAGTVNEAASKGYLDVLAGRGQEFKPNAPITRAEYLALVCRFQGIDVSSAPRTSSYTDVSSNHWAVKYINYCSDRGWVGGTGNNMFMPDRSVTRAEICTMTNHILGRIPDYAKAAATGPSFNDVSINHWAFYEIFEASRSHYATVVNGVETWT